MNRGGQITGLSFYDEHYDEHFYVGVIVFNFYIGNSYRIIYLRCL